MEFHNLDIVPEELHPFLVGGGIEKFGHVTPVSDESRRIVGDPLKRFLPTSETAELLLQRAFLGFQPGQFRLHARYRVDAKALQHFHKTPDVRFCLLLLAANYVFFLPQFARLRTKARQRTLDDPLASFHAPANLANSANDHFLDGFGRDAGSAARVLATFVVLPGADVIEVLARASRRREADHVRTATASENARKQVVAALRLYLEAGTPPCGFGKLKLHAVKLLFLDDRRVISIMHRVTPSHLADVHRVPEDARHLLLGEEVSAPLLTGTGAVGWVANALTVQQSSHRS